MKDFMSFLLESFTRASGGNEDNSYSRLNRTTTELLDFPTPQGVRLTLSSLATPNFATSYQLGTIGVVDGSITYLYSSVPLAASEATQVQSDRIPLPRLLKSYRQLTELDERNALVLAAREARAGRKSARELLEGYWKSVRRPFVGRDDRGDGGRVIGADVREDSVKDVALVHDDGVGVADKSDHAPARTRRSTDGHNLLYGRLYLPESLLEILVARRPTPNLQVQMVAVSQSRLRSGGTLLGSFQYDEGHYGLEGLASSDGGLLGLRGVYNFGGDASPLAITASPGDVAVNAIMNEANEEGTIAATTASQKEFSSPIPQSFPSSSLPDGLASSSSSSSTSSEKERIYGRFTAGGELYYGTLNKSGGMSVGGRFQTLPTYRGSPLTATLTVNPLMGNIAASYAVAAQTSYKCSLATRMSFNVYSYESEWAVGMELWTRKRRLDTATTDAVVRRLGPPVKEYPERSFGAKMEWRLDEPVTMTVPTTTKGKSTPSRGDDGILGVLKARLDQNLNIGLLWEGRFKALLFSLGSGIDLRTPGSPFKSVGLEVQYTS